MNADKTPKRQCITCMMVNLYPYKRKITLMSAETILDRQFSEWHMTTAFSRGTPVLQQVSAGLGWTGSRSGSCLSAPSAHPERLQQEDHQPAEQPGTNKNMARGHARPKMCLLMRHSCRMWEELRSKTFSFVAT